ncbi:MAG TPA: hypothetical protein VFI56_06600 [Vicinamibacterales bacterium]|nr:hypothetical protein [Vicinamibacterales bacterium]
MTRRCMACVLSLTLLLSSAVSLAAPGPASTPVDGGWPRAYTTTSGGQVTLFEPQIVSWTDQKWMVAYAAVAYAGKDDKMPALGTLRIEAATSVSVPERLVNFSQLNITMANFPTLQREQLTAVVSEINASVPREDRVIGLDRVLAAVDKSEIKPRNNSGVKADPPVVFYSTTPAVLVNLDGEPIWSPIKENDLKFAVNTNWDLFEHPPSNTYYLRVNTSWMKAPAVQGPWTPAGALPDSFARLPNDDNWKDARAALGSQRTPATAEPVFVSKKPAELILLRGAPVYAAVAGTKLFWVSNTDSDVFRVGRDGPIYYLVSGRWFTASTFMWPWTFATPDLPADFKRIPVDHPRSRVLASVPGTTQALEAVLLAQIPQTARVSRKEVKAPDVVYSGDPQFQPIEQIGVARALNTDKDVLRVGDLYYLCFQGVWFVAHAPNGPWSLADAVPEAIYKIPISSPAYNVTNVTVENSDDDAVYYAAEPAYTGMMVAWGCAVWGTGWYYPPYIGWGGYYPVYYPRYPSYGYGAWYNPWSGAYTRAGIVYGPYGGAGYAARYNPSTGTYARGAAAWGPGGARGAAQAWNPRTGTSAQTRQGANVYGSWGTTAVQRGDQWAQTARVSNRATGTMTRATQGSGGGGAVSRRGPDGGTTVGRTAGGDVFAGHDGNVYRNQGGSWQKYENGSWSNVQRATGTSGQLGTRSDQGGIPAGTRDQLNQDLSARREGSQRTSDFGAARDRGFTGAGSYRPSGGGFRGGGGGGFRGGGGGRR